MRALTVLYDSDCGLCRRVRDWLEAQPKYVEMEFVAAGSMTARRRFPRLDPEKTLREVTVVGDGGEVYQGAKAWLICLWALRRYRLLALDWSTPERMELAKRFVAWVSRNRPTKSPEGTFGGTPLRPGYFLFLPVLAFPICSFLCLMVWNELGEPSGRDLIRFSLSFTFWGYVLTFLVGLPLVVALRRHDLFRPRAMALAGTLIAILPFLRWDQPAELTAALASGALIGFAIWRAHTPYSEGPSPG
jgi:predicted DCC family thiol-disulfide oxidoreductase YuxK